MPLKTILSESGCIKLNKQTDHVTAALIKVRFYCPANTKGGPIFFIPRVTRRVPHCVCRCQEIVFCTDCLDVTASFVLCQSQTIRQHLGCHGACVCVCPSIKKYLSVSTATCTHACNRQGLPAPKMRTSGR